MRTLIATMCVGLFACGGSDGARDANPADVPACAPSCDGRSCGDDGCGGTCGSCLPPYHCGDAGACVGSTPGDTPDSCKQMCEAVGLLCGADGTCVAPSTGDATSSGDATSTGDAPSTDVAPPTCDQSCEQAGFECGEHCGVPCGTCGGEQDLCVGGKCACQSLCGATTCEQDDGCGGACGPCASLENCADCALRLSIVDQVIANGFVEEVTLALDFDPGAGNPEPSLADIRIALSGPAEVQSVGVGTVVLDAGKDLFIDANTGKPFRMLPGGIVQVLIFSSQSTKTIAAGRLLVMRVRIHQVAASDPPLGFQPAIFGLVEREEIFAPPSADAVIWGGGYDGPVVVWPEVAND